MVKFTKMHGIGNDFVLINGFEEKLDESEISTLSQKLCDRKFGIGSDGLIVATSGSSSPLAMRMWNPDGSESEMCGNGIRCFAIFVREEGIDTSDSLPVETGAGQLTVEILPDQRVRVNMGRAILPPNQIGMSISSGESFVNQSLVTTAEVQTEFGGPVLGTAVSMGNPHIVIFAQDIKSIDLPKVGSVLEHHELFPQRVNVHIVQVISKKHIQMRTWERGAGITLACGTGACACAVASFLNGLTERNVLVSLPGGDLEIDYLESGEVLMTGSATKVFSGQV